MKTSKPSSNTWKEAENSSDSSDRNIIKKHPENVYELEVINLGDIDILTLHEDIETIFKHLERGGKLKRFFRSEHHQETPGKCLRAGSHQSRRYRHLDAP